MKRLVLVKSCVGIAILVTLLSPSLSYAGNPEAIVWVADDGGLGAETAKSARRIAAAALNEAGIETAEPPEVDRVQPLDDTAKRIGAGLGIEEIYVLKLSRLGGRVVATATLYDESFTAVRSRQMTALRVEDLETVVPRLMLAVARNESKEDTAEVDTVSERETAAWNKKHGEFLFGVGILLAGGFHRHAEIQYGLDLKIAYEMKLFRIDFDLAGAAGIPEFDDALVRAGLGLTYLPLARDWTPYIGASLDYVFGGVADEFRGGVGITSHLGVEGFRLHRARFLVELGATFPLFHFDGFYAPIGFGAVCVLW